MAEKVKATGSKVVPLLFRIKSDRPYVRDYFIEVHQTSNNGTKYSITAQLDSETKSWRKTDSKATQEYMDANGFFNIPSRMLQFSNMRAALDFFDYHMELKYSVPYQGGVLIWNKERRDLPTRMSRYVDKEDKLATFNTPVYYVPNDYDDEGEHYSG